MRARRAWSVYALGTLAGLAGLALLTRMVLARARATAEAAVEAQLAEDQRAALARMDLSFGPLLARAAARAELATTAGEVRAFVVELPSGNPSPTPETSALAQPLRARADAAWSSAAPEFAPLVTLPPRGNAREQWVQRADERSTQEYLARAQTNYANNPNVSLGVPLLPPESLAVRTGALQAAWEDGGATLAFVRRRERGGVTDYQTFRFAWPPLAELLTSLTRDLFPAARLEPLAPDAGPSGDRLATLPARLVVDPPPVELGADRALVASLAGAWLLALVAAAGAALALRASLADAERQRRFTAAVTHELRTPLTTLRLYGEMLARGMVPADRAQEYLCTLDQEAGRLGALVENVLAHAQLERGRPRAVLERVSLAEVVERHRAGLERRCERAGAALAVELGPDAAATIETDVAGAGLVLSNLVDNACKYGAPPLRLAARRAPGRIGLALSDAGPGVPAARVRAIFRPFERGARDGNDPTGGIGLGLALAREVARAAGGDVVLEPSERGACFVLWLAAAREPGGAADR